MDANSWTAGWEGCRQAVYDDADDHVLAPGEIPKGTATVGRGHTGPDVIPGAVWTMDRIEKAFGEDCDDAKEHAMAALGHVLRPIGDARDGVLQDMCFELGQHGLDEFHQMLAALRVGDWGHAHDACLQSLYAEQSKRRATANAEILRTGFWPSVHPNDPSIT